MKPHNVVGERHSVEKRLHGGLHSLPMNIFEELYHFIVRIQHPENHVYHLVMFIIMVYRVYLR